jgi:hypothetical protein
MLAGVVWPGNLFSIAVSHQLFVRGIALHSPSCTHPLPELRNPEFLLVDQLDAWITFTCSLGELNGFGDLFHVHWYLGGKLFSGDL